MKKTFVEVGTTYIYDYIHAQLPCLEEFTCTYYVQFSNKNKWTCTFTSDKPFPMYCTRLKQV